MTAGAPLFVKICGITRVEDAEAAVLAGASAIGLNFVPTSKRKVEEVLARRIADSVRGRIVVVGVVADLDAADAARLRDAVGLHALQLHGDESPETVRALGPGAFKAARIGDAEDARRAAGYPGDWLLLDAKVPGELGGTGAVFDWSLAAGLAAVRKVLLAGGLTEDNVARAVETVRPFGVDVASGVESAPGVKDEARVRAFVRAARDAASRAL